MFAKEAADPAFSLLSAAGAFLLYPQQVFGVCPYTVTWHFQVGEDVSSSYIINLALPTPLPPPELKALSQLCWMHWDETLHSKTSLFPYIRIAFFVFPWQKWQ